MKVDETKGIDDEIYTLWYPCPYEDCGSHIFDMNAILKQAHGGWGKLERYRFCPYCGGELAWDE